MRVHAAPRLLREMGLGLIFAFAFVSTLSAQERTAPAHPQTQASERPGESAASGHAGKAEEGEDETAAFKQSGAVQFVAKTTGLSLHAAYWLCVLLNFAVIAAAIIWFSRSSLPQMFRNRSEAIRKAMDEARRASEEASRRLSEIEGRLSRLDSEISAMRTSAEQEAAAEEQRIRAAAQEDKRKIVEGAEQEIAAAAKLARRELTAFVADLAVSLAEKKIAVDKPTDETLVRNFADRLSNGKDGR
jgi:F-type H+-transporting ATPase subunit b